MRVNRKNEIDFEYGPLVGIKKDGTRVVILSEDMLGDEFVIEPAVGNSPAKLRIDVSKLGAVVPVSPGDPVNPGNYPQYIGLNLDPLSPTSNANGEIFVVVNDPTGGVFVGASLVQAGVDASMYDPISDGVYYIVDENFGTQYVELVVEGSKIKSITLIDGMEILYVRLETSSQTGVSYIDTFKEDVDGTRSVSEGDILYSDPNLISTVPDGIFNYYTLMSGVLMPNSITTTAGVVSTGFSK